MLGRRTLLTQLLGLIGCARLIPRSIQPTAMPDDLPLTAPGAKPLVSPQDFLSCSDDAIDRFCAVHGCDARLLDALDSVQKRILALRLLQPEMNSSRVSDALGVNIRKVQRTMLKVVDLLRTQELA